MHAFKNLPVNIAVLNDLSTPPADGQSPVSVRTGGGRPFLRRLSSLTLFFSGLVLVATSLVLLAAPPAHVAHFCSWRALGLGRGHWNLLHIMSGLLFMAAIPFHVYFNWKAMFAFLRKRRSGEMPFLSRPFVAALVLTVYVCAGSFLGLPPMKQIMQGLRSVKISYIRKYGTPPFGEAEHASLVKVASYMGWNANRCLAALRGKGYSVESVKQSVGSIAKNNQVTTSVVLEEMRK